MRCRYIHRHYSAYLTDGKQRSNTVDSKFFFGQHGVQQLTADTQDHDHKQLNTKFHYVNYNKYKSSGVKRHPRRRKMRHGNPRRGGGKNKEVRG